MTQHGRHSKNRPHYWLGASTVVVVLLLVVASSRWWAAESGKPAAAVVPRGQHGTPTAAVTSAPSDDPQALAAAAVESCRAKHAAQAPVLLAADRSLEQWRTHVEAMNQLVAGEITLEQASAFWEQTRVGAAERVQRFTADDDAYRRADSRCPWAAAQLRPGDVPELQQCRQATAARDDLLSAARVAVTTWHHHVHDMERLRAGELSPEQATELWLRNWRQGVDELDTYAARARTADKTSC